jgi:hypothetical protein
VRLATAHRLRQIERAVLAFAGQPLKAAPDQQFQPLGEVVTLEKRPAIDLAGREVLDLCDLFDQLSLFTTALGVHSCLTVAIGIFEPRFHEARARQPTLWREILHLETH